MAPAILQPVPLVSTARASPLHAGCASCRAAQVAIVAEHTAPSAVSERGLALSNLRLINCSGSRNRIARSERLGLERKLAHHGVERLGRGEKEAGLAIAGRL